MTTFGRFDLAVIGGGFTGLHSAAHLADAGLNVLVLERADGLMAQTSTNNFARIHHGWHYPGSYATGLECLGAAFDFLECFGDLMLREGTGRT